MESIKSNGRKWASEPFTFRLARGENYEEQFLLIFENPDSPPVNPEDETSVRKRLFSVYLSRAEAAELCVRVRGLMLSWGRTSQRDPFFFPDDPGARKF